MRRRLTAAFALGVFVLALVLPSLTSSHAWADADLAGTEAGLFVGHPTTQIESPRRPVGPEHCALCHWLRSLGSSVVAGSPVGPLAVEVGLPLYLTTASLTPADQARRPARAPPAALVA